MKATAPYPRLVGHGLLLRAWEDRDVPEMVGLFDDREVARWTPLASPFDLSAAHAYLTRSRTVRAEGRGAGYAITTDGVQPLGEVLIFGLDAVNGTAEMGYTVGASHRGQGLASRAVELVAEHARDDLGLRQVRLRIQVWNEASQAVARAVGFAPAGLPPETVDHRGGRVLLEIWTRDLEQPSQDGV